MDAAVGLCCIAMAEVIDAASIQPLGMPFCP
jgi:hypothetical protein